MDELSKLNIIYILPETLTSGFFIKTPAHEDKGVTGNESDGYSKVAHRDMDIHNNEVGRNIGQNNIAVSENEMTDIIYQEIQSPMTRFIWLHE